MKSIGAKKTLLILCVIAAGLAAIWIRAFFGSMKAYEEGLAHARSGRIVEAVSLFDRSIRWYAPLNPYVFRSVERLWEIGLKAEEASNVPLALMAFRTIRVGLHAARGLHRPGREWMDRCDEKIEAVLARQKDWTGGTVGIPAEPTAEPAIAEIRDPHPAWSLVVTVAFLGWIGSAMGLIRHGFKETEQPALHGLRTALWLSCIAAFFLLWLLGMMKA